MHNEKSWGFYFSSAVDAVDNKLIISNAKNLFQPVGTLSWVGKQWQDKQFWVPLIKPAGFNSEFYMNTSEDKLQILQHCCKWINSESGTKAKCEHTWVATVRDWGSHDPEFPSVVSTETDPSAPPQCFTFSILATDCIWRSAEVPVYKTGKWPNLHSRFKCRIEILPKFFSTAHCTSWATSRTEDHCTNKYTH